MRKNEYFIEFELVTQLHIPEKKIKYLCFCSWFKETRTKENQNTEIDCANTVLIPLKNPIFSDYYQALQKKQWEGIHSTFKLSRWQYQTRKFPKIILYFQSICGFPFTSLAHKINQTQLFYVQLSWSQLITHSKINVSLSNQ
jgi:hypothetical protein